MKVEKLAAIAEIISSIAILITLVFLAVQTGQNTQAIAEQTAITRYSVYDVNNTSIIDWRSSLIENPELLSTWLRLANSPDASGLSPQERSTGYFLATSLFSIYDNAYMAYELGVMDVGGWERFRDRICVDFNRFQNTAWPNAKPFLNSRFAEFVENGCD
jgi:hypothetical protein